MIHPSVTMDQWITDLCVSRKTSKPKHFLKIQLDRVRWNGILYILKHKSHDQSNSDTWLVLQYNFKIKNKCISNTVKISSMKNEVALLSLNRSLIKATIPTVSTNNLFSFVHGTFNHLNKYFLLQTGLRSDGFFISSFVFCETFIIHCIDSFVRRVFTKWQNLSK